jgi:hypothetical protein
MRYVQRDRALAMLTECRMSRFRRLRQQREGRYQGSGADAGTMAPAFSGLGRVRPAALAALAVEIAKLEAATVKRGGANNPEGLGGKSGKKSVHKIDNRVNATVDNDRNDRNQQSGLLRRLAKQGRDDLLDRVASGELRKDFTPTERVAIAKAIEEEIGNRQGKRTDLELVVERPQVKGDKTRAIAAEKAGFGSEVTYRRAKAVVPSISRTTADMSSFHLNSRLFRFSQNQSFDPVG